MYSVKVLIAEDEKALRDMIAKYLKREGFVPLEAEDGKQARQIVESETFDLAILDVMMPYESGFNIAAKIRQQDASVPIIMLTARTSTEDKIQGFEAGADQYVPKPFSMKELMVRVKSVLKKKNINAVDMETTLGCMYINTSARIIKVHDEIIDLTPREYDLLMYLTDNKDLALSRDMILERVWGYDYDCDERTVDTFVQRLRKKLKKAGDYIHTVRAMGYKFHIEE